MAHWYQNPRFAAQRARQRAQEVEDFNRLLYGLPQELFDNIFKLVVTVESNDVIEVDMKYKPPKALQITRSIRSQHVARYYSTNKFLASEGYPLLSRWLARLPPEHRSLITEVRVPLWDKCCVGLPWKRSRPPGRQYRRMVVARIRDHLNKAILGWKDLPKRSYFKTDCMDKNGKHDVVDAVAGVSVLASSGSPCGIRSRKLETENYRLRGTQNGNPISKTGYVGSWAMG